MRANAIARPSVILALLAVAGSAAVATADVTVKGKDGSVQVELPDGWAKMETPPSATDAVQLMAINKRNDTGMLVGTEDRSDVTWTLDEYAKRALDRLKKAPRFTDVSQTDLRPLRVAGHPAVRCEFRCTVGGVRLAYLNTYVQTDKNFISVSAWSTQSKFDRLKPGLAKLADGVKETEPPAEK